ncbi:extracellular solute-binding protein [Paenibacillus dokdonensis]|uniref:extracellular solute-binding protein n=1 Tax=Paenibacillus dokdonensis TaxID=2567944 RepID=UPI0010A89C3D|nr:extracellular solute-binding protein [Paenibacillus dokdonensis]
MVTKKRPLATVIFMLFVSLVLLLAGCSKSGGGADKGSEDAGQNADNQKPLKISVMAGSFGATPKGTLIQEEWQKRMESYIGRKLDIDWTYVPWGEYGDKFKLTLASGDLPDIMTNFGGELAIQYGRQGIVLDIAKYMNDMPNYKKYVDNTPYAKTKLYTPEGNMYYFGDGWWNEEGNEGTAYGSIYRFDLFKKHNIKIPETLDEFYDAAKKLKGVYPDSYPVNTYSSWPAVHEGLLYSNHTSLGLYWNGEKYVYGPVEDAFKETLMFLNKLYKEKLLDPEFATQSDDQVKQKMATGKSFMMPLTWYGNADELNKMSNEGAEWGGALLPNNPKYGKAWKGWSAEPGKLLSNNNGVLISAKAKEPELLVKMIDYQYSDEMVNLLNWGIEGVTYEVKDGKKQFLPEITNDPIPAKKLEPFGVSSSGSNRSGFVFTPQDFASDIAKYKPMPFYADGQYMTGKSKELTNKYGGKESIAPNDRAPNVTLNKEQEATKSEIMTPIETYVSESVIKFVTGATSFDQWDKYLADINKMGDYTLVLKMMNDAVAVK